MNNSIWHGASEKPQRKEQLILVRVIDGQQIIATGSVDGDFDSWWFILDNLFNFGLKAANVIGWCYQSQLIEQAGVL